MRHRAGIAERRRPEIQALHANLAEMEGPDSEVIVCESQDGAPVAVAHAVMLSVTDDGEGMSDERVEKIFEPFFTTKFSGTGLGLAIVERIADAHHGRLEAHNRNEGGAIFELTFPIGSKEQQG